jgi:uncharacterized protein (TIGR02145 family)
MNKILISAFDGIPFTAFIPFIPPRRWPRRWQKAVIILILTGVWQISKAQTGSIIINQNNNAGTITRQIDSSGYSSIWNFTNKSTGWTSTINYTKLAPCPGTPTVYYAGQTYHTVQIGSQCWLMENLNVGTMINGSQEQTNNGVIEKYCYNDSSANCAAYGGLYQWAEAMQYKNGATDSTSPNPAFSGNVQGICPGGWHIPTYNEFDTLETTVIQGSNALKAIGQGTGKGAGTNTSGFSALLAGGRDGNGGFGALSSYANIWSSTEGNDASADILFLEGDNIPINLPIILKVNGYSVRCVKN